MRSACSYITAMRREAIGLDIGGANLKAATGSGEAVTVPFELWRHPDRLPDALTAIRQRWPEFRVVAVTMTGELCDCFPTKRDGVRHILASVEQAFSNCQVGVWSTSSRFVSVEAAVDDHLAIAAANWHGLATYAGRLAPHGPAILIDTGSTTTDIVPLAHGIPRPSGRTDPERLQSGELVYMGVRRTPICAVLGAAVAAEFFATTHDAYVLLGQLQEEPDNRSTADGRAMTRENAHARLSRMLGGDPEITTAAQTNKLALQVFESQRRTIGRGVRRVIELLSKAPHTVLVSGAGEFLARAAWNEVSADSQVISLTEQLGSGRSTAACAYALAVLASENWPWD